MVSAYALAPYALKTPSKLRFALGLFFQNKFLVWGGGLVAMVPWCHSGAIRRHQRTSERPYPCQKSAAPQLINMIGEDSYEKYKIFLLITLQGAAHV